MIPPEVTSITDAIVQFASEYTRVTAIVVAWLASWVLYGVLGKRYLGADDDYWERIRGWVLPILSRLAEGTGLYAVTTMTPDEFAGTVQMTEDEFERRLKRAGFLRQPLASLHRNERGWKEDGSWSRSHGVVLPVARLLNRLPLSGSLFRRFLSAVDTVFALRQLHVVYFTESKESGTVIYVYAHDEPNPLNPVMAFKHYTGVGFRAAPGMARKALAAVDVDLSA